MRRIFMSFSRWFASLPVENGYLALGFIFLSVLCAGFESAYVQTATTHRVLSRELLQTPSFLFLLSLDLLVPLTVALLSRRFLFLYFAGQCFLSTILLHYTIFFYNPLTLSTIYHSMHGAASLGMDIFSFVRWNLVAGMAAFFAFKILLVQLGRIPDRRMPRIWGLRGITAVGCMAVIWVISSAIYGRTGMSVLWVDSRGHRTATERRLEEGTREAVRTIGYVATWIGEWVSGTYQDTDLIYAEARCLDPDTAYCAARETDPPGSWNGLPVPELGNTVVFVQVESLDYGVLGMEVNDRPVVPFIDALAGESVTLKVFAPHKVGSSNSDYEILNARRADQNVIYYEYIKEYPDSAIKGMAASGYATTVFHGLSGNLFHLRQAYAAQGAERQFFKEELVAAGYKPSAYIMNHVMDGELFHMASTDLERQRAKREKQFQFIVTMSSHIPFIDALPEFKGVGGTFSRYVSSLRYFDESFASFYETLPPGTVVVLWGDHGSDVTYPSRYPDNKRHVPFMVNVKGNDAWRNGLTADVEKSRVYTLCELGYYLRKIVSNR